MYYRKKLLLALIEAFGGSLTDTDSNKLLFLFGQRTGRHYYDFIPYRYGAFSYVLFRDKLNLTQAGLLKDTSKFELAGRSTHRDRLLPDDRAALDALTLEIGKTRGKQLIRKIYREFPYYASRSLIASEVLSLQEMQSVRRYARKTHKPCLFSIGYEGLSIDAYLDKLIANQIYAVIDVRKNPLSMKYGFSKSQLQGFVENQAITYYHIPELGIESSLRQDLHSKEAYIRLFTYYKAQILPKNSTALDTIRALVKKHRRVALTCFEAIHTSCHRHKITEYFEEDPTFDPPIIHL